MEKTVISEKGCKNVTLREGGSFFMGFINIAEGLGYIFYRKDDNAVGMMSFDPDRPDDEHITLLLNCGDEFREMTAHSKTLLPAETVEKALAYYEEHCELPPFITFKSPYDN